MSQGGKKILSFLKHAIYLRTILSIGILLGIPNRILLSQTATIDVRIGRVSKLQAAEVEREAALFMQYLEQKAPGFRFRVVHLRSDAVVKGDVDVGVLSISELPQLCHSGRFSMNQFRVLPPRLPYPMLQGLQVPASTRLYPGTAFVRMPHVGDKLAERVASAPFELAVSRIMDSTGRMTGSVGGLRDITERKRLEEQLLAFGRKQVLHLQVLNLNLLVNDTERLLRRLIREDIELLLDPDPAVGNVKADPGQIQHVIMNLAINARDALPKGARLTLRTSKTEFGFDKVADHEDIAPGRYILLMVEDNGVGMDETTRKRIFEPFFTTKETGKGTGLGLSTVYGIVKQSGGHIWVQSELGKGTKFSVCLPEISSTSELIETPRSAPSPRGKGKVLIVEDQAEVRDPARKILTACGYQVAQAANGAAALRLGESGEAAIDLLLTDVIMPGMTGPELAARMKSRHPVMKVLFMSGYSDSESALRAGLGEEGEYLQKPFLPTCSQNEYATFSAPSGKADFPHGREPAPWGGICLGGRWRPNRTPRHASECHESAFDLRNRRRRSELSTRRDPLLRARARGKRRLMDSHYWQIS